MDVTVGLRLRDDHGVEWVVYTSPDENGDFRLISVVGTDFATGRVVDVVITPVSTS